jgi:hypothetical protein
MLRKKFPYLEDLFYEKDQNIKKSFFDILKDGK